MKKASVSRLDLQTKALDPTSIVFSLERQREKELRSTIREAYPSEDILLYESEQLPHYIPMEQSVQEITDFTREREEKVQDVGRCRVCQIVKQSEKEKGSQEGQQNFEAHCSIQSFQNPKPVPEKILQIYPAKQSVLGSETQSSD